MTIKIEGFGKVAIALSAACLLLATGAAAAADLPTQKAPPPPPAPAPPPPPSFFVKLGLTYAINTSASKLYSQTVPLPGFPQYQLPGVGANIADFATLGVEAGYFIMPDVSIDISAGIPMYAKVTTKGTFPPGTLPVPDGTRLSSVMPSVIPVTVVYHFTEFGRFQPYLGAGVTPVFSFAQKSGFNTGVSVDATVGAVLQAGMDIMLDEHWGWSFDVKKVFAQGNSHSTGDNLAAIGLAGQAPLAGTLKTNFEPWLLSTGVTYRF